MTQTLDRMVGVDAIGKIKGVYGRLNSAFENYQREYNNAFFDAYKAGAITEQVYKTFRIEGLE